MGRVEEHRSGSEVNESTSRTLLESRALRGRLAIALRNSEASLNPVVRTTAEDREVLLAELALVRQAQELLLRPARGLL